MYKYDPSLVKHFDGKREFHKQWVLAIFEDLEEEPRPIEEIAALLTQGGFPKTLIKKVIRGELQLYNQEKERTRILMCEYMLERIFSEHEDYLKLRQWLRETSQLSPKQRKLFVTS